MKSLLAFFAAVVVAAVIGVASAAAQPQASEQVVFSGIGTSSSPFHVFGFWIWCEAESENPYAGACQGAMYIYDVGLVAHVSGSIDETGADLYTMTVAGKNGLSCTLTNESSNSGPTNTVDVTCSANGVPQFTGASTNAVVNVTGP